MRHNQNKVKEPYVRHTFTFTYDEVMQILSKETPEGLIAVGDRCLVWGLEKRRDLGRDDRGCELVLVVDKDPRNP